MGVGCRVVESRHTGAANQHTPIRRPIPVRRHVDNGEIVDATTQLALGFTAKAKGISYTHHTLRFGWARLVAIS